MSARIAAASLCEDYGACRLDMTTVTIERRSTVAGGAQHAAANTIGERQTGYWWFNSVPTPMKRRCSERTPQGLCDNFINALKILANQQKDCDSPIKKHCHRPAREKSIPHGWAMELH